MSSNRGIEVRFTFPAGLQITEHLRTFKSSRARNMEIMRLAENALLTQQGVALSPSVEHEKDHAQQSQNSSPQAETAPRVEEKEQPSEQSALSSMNLMTIGSD